MSLIKHLRNTAKCLRVIASSLCKFCLDPFQNLEMTCGVFATFNVILQYRCPTYNLLLPQRLTATLSFPLDGVWASILAKMFCPCLKLMLSSQLPNDIVKHIITRILVSWNLLFQLGLCLSSTDASGICFDKVSEKGYICPARISSDSSCCLFLRDINLKR